MRFLFKNNAYVEKEQTVQHSMLVFAESRNSTHIIAIVTSNDTTPWNKIYYIKSKTNTRYVPMQWYEKNHFFFSSSRKTFKSGEKLYAIWSCCVFFRLPLLSHKHLNFNNGKTINAKCTATHTKQASEWERKSRISCTFG